MVERASPTAGIDLRGDYDLNDHTGRVLLSPPGFDNRTHRVEVPHAQR